jgi:putative transposase
MGRSRYKTFPDGNVPYFFTCTTVNWIDLFGDARLAQILLDSFKFLVEKNRLILHGYVIMKNHVHLIASGEHVSREIGNFKSYTARSIIDLLRNEHNDLILRQLKLYKKKHKIYQKYQLWQEDSHPEMIQTHTMLIQKLDYIHYNPVRKGYVDDPAQWSHSSYRDYHGGKGLIPITIIGM